MYDIADNALGIPFVKCAHSKWILYRSTIFTFWIKYLMTFFEHKAVVSKFIVSQARPHQITGDTSPGPPNFKGPHEAFYFQDFFTFLGCIFMLILFLSLSIALSGLNERTLG